MGFKRLIIALIFVPILFLFIYISQISFLVLVALVTLVGQYEFYRFFYKEGSRPAKVFGLILGLLLLLSFYFKSKEIEVVPIGILISGSIIMVLLFHLLWVREIANALQITAVTFFGIFYVNWLMGHLLLLRGLGNGPYLIIFLLMVAWITDTAAYIVGSSIGRYKLFPTVSPNKTVEGTIGGIGGSLLAGLIGRAWFLPGFGFGEAVKLSLLLGILTQLGDLSESMLKRSAGVKDSGTLIPAHGGVLDKIDGVLFATPVLYYYIHIFKMNQF